MHCMQKAIKALSFIVIGVTVGIGLCKFVPGFFELAMRGLT